MVSIIIPAYNEATSIAAVLAGLKCVCGNFEVLVADGSSTDRTAEIVHAFSVASPHPLRLVECVRNRALQCNSAVQHANGDVCLFLHADILVAPGTVEAVECGLLDPNVIGGNFQIVFEGDNFVERFFTWCYRVRRPFGIYYGDSGIFVRREVFERLGGFNPIPIMDDYEFVRRMERAGRTVCLNPPMTVSARRWRVQGLFPTLFSWVWIQTLYSLGVPAERLARWYAPVRNPQLTHEALEVDDIVPGQPARSDWPQAGGHRNQGRP
jgi:rSAM/selenodomain-associated transferase 2